jgi:hypothetical protein
LKITEKRLRKIIRSTLNEFDNPPGQNFDKDYLDKKFPMPKKKGFGLDNVKDLFSNAKLDYEKEKEKAGANDKKPNIPTVFRRKFSINPISAIQYFKDIITKDQSEFMNFMHVFLDFMLNVNDSLHNDRENFKTNYEQLIPIFIQYLRQHQSQGNYISQDLVRELGEFFRVLGQRLRQVNFGDSSFHEEEGKEYNEFRESRVRRKKR